MIRPGIPAPNLAPRLGREVVRQRGGVEYRELVARSLVNRCNSPRVPFEWTVNPYRGCAMGCRYCYAAYTHEYLGLEAAGSFHSTIYAKSFGPDETLRQLQRVARRGERIALGTATDPYQPGETELGVTRRFLECAAQVRGLRLGHHHQGRHHPARPGPARAHPPALAALGPGLAQLDWTPSSCGGSSRGRRRPRCGSRCCAGSPRRACAWGCRSRRSCRGSPTRKPGSTTLIGRAAGVGVRRMWGSLLFLRSPTREKYFDFIAREFPRYLEAYRRAYAGVSHLTGAYRSASRRWCGACARSTACCARTRRSPAPTPASPSSSTSSREAPDPRRRASFGYRLLS